MRRRSSSCDPFSRTESSETAAAPRALEEALEPEVREGVLEVGEGALDASHLLAGHVLEGEDDAAVPRRGGAPPVVALVAVEDPHGARRGRHREIAGLAVGLPGVEPAEEAARRVLDETD